jgi:hypothetical protein
MRVIAVGFAARHEIVELAIGRVAGQRAFGPVMLVRRVVKDEVQTQADAGFAQVFGQRAQFFHRAERGIDIAIAADRIAAVALAIGRLEQRHQMQIRQPERLEVRQPGADTLEIIGEQVDIGDPADHFLGLEPAGIGFTLCIERLQISRALHPCCGSGPNQRCKLLIEVRTAAIQRAKERPQMRAMLCDAFLKRAPCRAGGFEFMLFGDRPADRLQLRRLDQGDPIPLVMNCAPIVCGIGKAVFT